MLRAIHAHNESSEVRLEVMNGFCRMVSRNAVSTIPAENRHDVTATVNRQALYDALNSMEDQPITLDLHEHPAMKNVLYSYKITRHEDRPNQYESIQFTL